MLAISSWAMTTQRVRRLRSGDLSLHTLPAEWWSRSVLRDVGAAGLRLDLLDAHDFGSGVDDVTGGGPPDAVVGEPVAAGDGDGGQLVGGPSGSRT